MSLDLKKPAIYLITKGLATDADYQAAKADILDSVRLAVSENIDLVQIREKRLGARLLCDLIRSVAEITRSSKTKLLVNDRADIALACGADGVHLTSNSLPVAAIRDAFAADFVIGVSTHNIEEAKNATEADFAVFGPVFDTPGKSPAVRIENLRVVCQELCPFPIFGLGGIDASNAASVIESGAVGIAAIRSLGDSESLRLVREKIASLDE